MNDAALFSMLFVLVCAVAGSGFAAALFYRSATREVTPMALYEVHRTDTVGPGQFDNALVIAGGTAQARKAVAHLLPAGATVQATPVDVTGRGKPASLVSAYWDEREPAPAQDETLFDVTDPIGESLESAYRA